jgi:hypothetical protein
MVTAIQINGVSRELIEIGGFSRFSPDTLLHHVKHWIEVSRIFTSSDGTERLRNARLEKAVKIRTTK